MLHLSEQFQKGSVPNIWLFEIVKMSMSIVEMKGIWNILSCLQKVKKYGAHL